ncbi:MBL fold metallo-hydrolase, partial [Acidianus sp. RZ1]|uniref:MBL fold metallo-hydrolase n=1 Tax=Acidianus sp. RZ1 TaxID=1540082 RepID=UPI001490BC90
MSIDILKNGAILLGERFVVDGHYSRDFRIITHFHADHIAQLKKSISECIGLISTPVTIDVLSVLGYDIPFKKRFGINYGIKMKVEDEELSLQPSDHVFGSSQVVVSNKEGEKIGYTGDFKNPGHGTPILDVDILVIDSTYGSPMFRRNFKNDIEMLFADHVNDSLTRGPVKIFAYHGKIQEAMRVLRKYGVVAPFIVDDKIRKVTEIAKKYGYIKDDIFTSESEEGKEIIKEGWYIEFEHFNKSKQRDGRYMNYILSGWEFSEPIRSIDSRTKVVAMSDHAD